jgi:hypothetical protein
VPRVADPSMPPTRHANGCGALPLNGKPMNRAISRLLKGDCTGYLEPFSPDGLKRFGALTASNYADLMKTCPFPGRAATCGRASLPR